MIGSANAASWSRSSIFRVQLLDPATPVRCARARGAAVRIRASARSGGAPTDPRPATTRDSASRRSHFHGARNARRAGVSGRLDVARLLVGAPRACCSARSPSAPNTSSLDVGNAPAAGRGAGLRHLSERQVLGEPPRRQIVERAGDQAPETRGRPDADAACRARSTPVRRRARARARADRHSAAARAARSPCDRTARRGAPRAGPGARFRRPRVLRPAPRTARLRRADRPAAAPSGQTDGGARGRDRRARRDRAASAAPSACSASRVAASPAGIVASASGARAMSASNERAFRRHW